MIEGVEEGMDTEDSFTLELANDIIAAFNSDGYGVHPFLVIAQLYRKYCYFNRSPDIAFKDERVASVIIHTIIQLLTV